MAQRTRGMPVKDVSIAPANAGDRHTLLSIRNLSTQFSRPDGTVYAVNRVSFDVAEGETLGIVGESGSGKSVSFLSILGLLRGNGRVAEGEAWFDRINLLGLTKRQLTEMRGRDIGIVFQDPMTSLNPLMRVGDQISETLTVHRICSKTDARKRTIELLREVGISDPEMRYRNFPFEFSGGMRQRVMIAVALACEPRLLIADEPTTALDVTVQMQILAVLRKAQNMRGMTTVIITHDFGVATNFCDRIIVMYGGQIMETAPVGEFIKRPAHPYTIGLKGSILEIGARRQRLVPIPGSSPTMLELPTGCPFVDRCFFAVDRCRTEVPALRFVGPSHTVACHRAEEVMEGVC